MLTFIEKAMAALTWPEFKELLALKRELFGDDMFVELDEKDPRVRRYDVLFRKVMAW